MFETLTLEQYRQRIDNINSADRNNKKYTRRHRITEYLPGQATYNLGDYPAPFKIRPTEYDHKLVKDLAESGVELIQIHEEWNDAIRHLGADKFTSFDPEGLQQFVDLCHEYNIKVIPYISTGYFQITDPDFREDFARGEYDLKASYFNYRKCWAGSASWRKYMLPRTFAVLDKYGFDGIYNDWGYDGLDIELKKHPGSDKVVFPYDPEIEDLLCTVYNEVKRRGGIYKLHADLNNCPNCKDKVYDYLWIGEGVKENSFGIGKEYTPYVVPCQHMHFTSYEDPDFYYAKVIPFMQFPLLKTGRPITGKSICEKNIDYYFDGNDGEFCFESKVKEYMEKNPEGPYVYSLWSSIPDDINEYPRWKRFLSLYKPMVTQNSVAYIELRDCVDVVSEIPEDVYISMFVNEKKYIVVSNLSGKSYNLVLKDDWKNRESNEVRRCFDIAPGKIIFLEN